jgi:hypothetical protein
VEEQDEAIHEISGGNLDVNGIAAFEHQDFEQDQRNLQDVFLVVVG